ncbi:hypothetical protein NHX12_008340 [Muraenolepis orangiensis]|uniref:Uncharacterized protein n=1 Tax=Muraenolepis orangiensis TaxID=630683 RepID=A0A9Q0DJK0_9TELE|nr:hypothetical protein NHX12_008340 [Muraenolepis orangiensis]
MDSVLNGGPQRAAQGYGPSWALKHHASLTSVEVGSDKSRRRRRRRRKYRRGSPDTTRRYPCHLRQRPQRHRAPVTSSSVPKGRAPGRPPHPPTPPPLQRTTKQRKQEETGARFCAGYRGGHDLYQHPHQQK